MWCWPNADSVVYRALKFARRHWVGIAAASVLLVTLVARARRHDYEAKVQRVESGMPRVEAQSRLLTETADQHLKDKRRPGLQWASSSKCCLIDARRGQ